MLNVDPSCELAIVLGFCPGEPMAPSHKALFTKVHRSLIYNSKKLKTTPEQLKGKVCYIHKMEYYCARNKNKNKAKQNKNQKAISFMKKEKKKK